MLICVVINDLLNFHIYPLLNLICRHYAIIDINNAVTIVCHFIPLYVLGCV